ncbi:hypothetical protein [Spirosoma jeollabukense]
MDDFLKDWHAIPDSQSTEAKFDSLARVKPQVKIARDWQEGGKDSDAIYSGSAIKEGDSRMVYDFNRKGMVGGPFVKWMDQLIDDSTYQVQITYKDVYGNCWQLTHKRNRNNVVPLGKCSEP